MSRARWLLAMLLLPLLVPPVVGQEPVDVGVAAVDIATPVVAGKRAEIAITVRNEGSAGVVASLEVTWEDGTRALSGDPLGYRMFVASRSSSTFRTTFLADAARAGAQVLVARATASGDGNPDNDTRRADLFVHAPALALSFDPVADPVVAPGATTFLRFRLSNVGNGPDAPALSLAASEGWSVAMSSARPTLAAGQAIDGFLRVEAPSAANALALSLTAASSIHPDATRSASAPPLRVNDSAFALGRVLAIAELPNRAQAFDGEALALAATVSHRGETRALYEVEAEVDRRLATVSVALEDPSAASRLLPASPRPVLDLAPGESRRVTIRVAPDFALAAAARVNLSVRAVDRAVIEPRAPHATLAAVASVDVVKAGPDLAIGRLGLPPEVYAGDRVTALIEVANRGRVAAPESRLEVALRDNARVIASTTLAVPPLDPGAARDLVWPIDTGGLRGSLSVRAEVAPVAGDANREGETASVAIHVRHPSLEIRGPATLRLVPGSRFELFGVDGGFSVLNRGDRPERVVVHASSNHSWLSGAWTLEVGAGGVPERVPLRVDVPAYPGPLSGPLTLHAVVENRTSIHARHATAIALDDTEPPEIALLEPAATGLLGQVAPFVARAVDATGVARVTITVTAPSGARTPVPVERAGPDVWRGAFAPSEAGLHAIEARAEEATEDRRSHTHRSAWRVAGEPYGGLVPVNFNDSAILASRLLRFAEVRSGTTRSAEIDLGEGYRPFAYPFEVSAAGWRDGPKTVAVRATSLEGLVRADRWNVTLDTTPPAIVEASVRAVGDRSIELAAQTEGATGVVARFERAEGPLEVALDEEPGGLHRAVVPRPPGWSRVTFVARDAVGNEAVRIVEAERASTPLPALLAWGALALAGLIPPKTRCRGQDSNLRTSSGPDLKSSIVGRA